MGAQKNMVFGPAGWFKNALIGEVATSLAIQKKIIIINIIGCELEKGKKKTLT